jgi:hypothetical protein
MVGVVPPLGWKLRIDLLVVMIAYEVATVFVRSPLTHHPANACRATQLEGREELCALPARAFSLITVVAVESIRTASRTAYLKTVSLLRFELLHATL